jgi:hypothetical protein
MTLVKHRKEVFCKKKTKICGQYLLKMRVKTINYYRLGGSAKMLYNIFQMVISSRPSGILGEKRFSSKEK